MTKNSFVAEVTFNGCYRKVHEQTFCSAFCSLTVMPFLWPKTTKCSCIGFLVADKNNLPGLNQIEISLNLFLCKPITTNYLRY